MTEATKENVIALDDERMNRRERIVAKLNSAKETLSPSRLAPKVRAEQKEKFSAAGRRAGDFTKQHKYAVGGTAAALMAGAVGLMFWRRKRKHASIEQDGSTTVPSATELDASLGTADSITSRQAAPAAGAAV